MNTEFRQNALNDRIIDLHMLTLTTTNHTFNFAFKISVSVR